jgi:TRAP-type C4-dicarboxylate transport system substrate-binding protein
MKSRAVSLVGALVLMASVFLLASKPAAAAQAVNLVFGNQNPETGWEVSKATIPWQKQVTEASKGQITFRGYYAQSLFKGTDAWEAVKQGQTDVAWVSMGFFPGVASLSEWTMLPFIPYPSGDVGGDVMWQLYEKYPEIQKQFAEIKVLNFVVLQPFFWQMKSKAIKTLNDAKGVKVRTVGGPQADTIRAAGGSPVFLGINDVYQNMEKGVIDGGILPYEANDSFKIFELAKEYTMMNMGSNLFVIAMNLKKWNSLSPEHQKIIMDQSGRKGSAWWSKVVSDDLGVYALNQIKTKGPKPNIYTPPPDELAKWEAALTPSVWGKWVKDNEAKGFTNAKKILDEAVSMLKTAKK